MIEISYYCSIELGLNAALIFFPFNEKWKVGNGNDAYWSWRLVKSLSDNWPYVKL